jgi:hypothetical protein
MRRTKSRTAVRIASEPPRPAPPAQEGSQAPIQEVVLVPAQKTEPENAPNSFDFNNFLVIVPPKPIAISNLQKAWCRVADAVKLGIQHKKSGSKCRISPLVSIRCGQSGKPSGKPSDWNTTAIRRVPFRGVQPRSSGSPAGGCRPILERQPGLVRLPVRDKSLQTCKLPVPRRAA